MRPNSDYQVVKFRLRAQIDGLFDLTLLKLVSHRSHHIDAFYMIYDNMNSQKQFQQEDLHWGYVEKDLAI